MQIGEGAEKLQLYLFFSQADIYPISKIVLYTKITTQQPLQPLVSVFAQSYRSSISIEDRMPISTTHS